MRCQCKSDAHAKGACLTIACTMSWVMGIVSGWIIQVIIKPVPRGLHMKQISCFIWGVPLDIYEGCWIITLIRVNRPLQWLLSNPTAWPLPQEQPAVCLDHITICNCSIVSYGSCINPNMLFHSVAFKSKDTATKLIVLTIHFSEDYLGSWWH